MKRLKEFLQFLGFAIVCICIIFIPETVMYLIYSSLSPETVLEKIFIYGFFWVCGSTICMVFLGVGGALLTMLFKTYFGK